LSSSRRPVEAFVQQAETGFVREYDGGPACRGATGRLAPASGAREIVPAEPFGNQLPKELRGHGDLDRMSPRRCEDHAPAFH